MQRLLRSGLVEGIKPGHDWLVYEDSLKAFLAKPRKSGPKGPRKKVVPDKSDVSLGEAERSETSPDES